MFKKLALALTFASSAFVTAALESNVPATATAPSEAPLPGLDTSALSPEQVEAVRRFAELAFCPCGCPHTLAACLRGHAVCKHAARMLSMAVRLAVQGAGAEDIHALLSEYYASFDRSKRAKLDVKDFGPPLGDPSAPITFVEFSDFTCPYCQALRSALEQFVTESQGRVKLYYKPFPLSSHPRAREAATAAEYARDHGFFWQMHDLLFSQPQALSDDDLTDAVRTLGGEKGDAFALDLLKALSDDRYASRIGRSQAEAREAGLHGTPTIFINGRRLNLSTPPDGMGELLRATLADEEEWTKNARWAKD